MADVAGVGVSWLVYSRHEGMATHAVIGGKTWHDWRMQFPQAARAATEGLILPFGPGVN